MQLPFADLARWGRQALFAACVCGGLLSNAWAQSADVAGVHYPPAIKVEGVNLVLNGSGITYRAVAKLYTVGLYLTQKSSKAPEVIDHDAPKQLRFVMLQGMRIDELGKTITKGIEGNSSRDQFFKLIPSIRKMGEEFSHIRRMSPGDVFTIEYVPKRGTMFYLNGQPVGLPLDHPYFFPAVLRTWLGDKPATQDLKDALLDYKAPPVLDALQ